MDPGLAKLQTTRIALEETLAKLEAGNKLATEAVERMEQSVSRMQARRLFNPARMTTPGTDD